MSEARTRDTGSIETGPNDTGSVETGPNETGPIETGPEIKNAFARAFDQLRKQEGRD